MQSFFTADEMKCRGCGKLVMDETFMGKLNLARWIAGVPFVVNSGYRCPKHNKEVGSTSDNHTKGKAADIQCRSGASRFELIKALIGAGMMGIGIGKSFIHADTNRETTAIWTY